jgi:hypothetical protein
MSGRYLSMGNTSRREDVYWGFKINVRNASPRLEVVELAWEPVILENRSNI